ncbi:hypothetical protein AAGW05_12625 [Arthrobacter sp. LAPM80]|uniref:hypothetical protein n=1 Tax=Arthrobacter sp. LAPM80 TaxID=3141788 RepID=UPI00398A8EBF
MGVGNEQLEQPPLDTGVVLVGMSIMVMVVVMVVSIVMPVALWVVVTAVIVVAVTRLSSEVHAVL